MTNGKYDYVSVDRIFAKIERDLGMTFDEGQVIEWIGEALEFIGSAPFYEPAIAFITVKNHQASVPNGTHQIKQIARNHRWNGVDENALCPADVLRDIKNCTETLPTPPNSLPIPLDCYGSPLMDYDIAYYRPYYDLRDEYYGWSWAKSNLYQSSFVPIRKATTNFFDTQNKDGQCISSNGRDEYQVIRKKILRFSFKEGQIALSYDRQAIDEETGYPLVPDTIEHTTAIVAYVTLRLMKRDMYNKREGSIGLVERAEYDWQWYCKQASNYDLMPRGEDDYQNLMDQRNRILPNNKQYYGFFGNMSIPEGRRWNDPDHRNYSLRYFRGTNGNPAF